MDKNGNKKKEFTSQEIELPNKDKQAFIKRMQRRNLGIYKMGTFSYVRNNKKITSIASILHFNIEECLNHPTLRTSDKEIIRNLKCLR